MSDLWAAMATRLDKDGHIRHHLVHVGTREQCEDARKKHGTLPNGVQLNQGRCDVVPHDRWLELQRRMRGLTS